MVARCREAGLPEPDFEQRAGQFVVTMWRDLLTGTLLDELGLNDRQKKGITFVKRNMRITNTEYQHLTGALKKTASRDLDNLVSKHLFKKVGKTGRGTYYG